METLGDFFRLAPDPVPYETTTIGQGVIMKKSAALLLALGLAGCQSTGVMPLGPDTYRIQARAGGMLTGGSMAAQKSALEQANNYCAQQGQQFVAIGLHDNSRGSDGSAASGILTTFVVDGA